MRIEISIKKQTLDLFEGANLVKTYPISTSKFGIGSREGSNHTPLGEFIVAEKIGHDCPLNTIFKGRDIIGEWDPAEEVEEDMILSRVLWLDGMEPHNENTKSRYIYIHGTNEEAKIGMEASHGCIRMRNDEVIELFERVDAETPVGISL